MTKDVSEASHEFFSRSDIVSDYVNLQGLTPAENVALDGPLTPGLDILDVGIGTGRTTHYPSHMCRQYVGIDYVPEMVNAARQTFPDLDIRVGDARNLHDFADGSLDMVIFSFNGLDCLDFQGRISALEEFHRVLRHSGTLVFSSHDPWSVLRITPRAPKRRRLKAIAVSVLRTMKALGRAVLSPSTWAGHGYRYDLADPFILYHATPKHIRSEVRARGFEVTRVVPSTSWGNTWMRPAW